MPQLGQPTLRRRLRLGDMAALDQRVQLRCVIPLFSDDAVRLIHAHARGMPRAINRLAATALLAACTDGKAIADEQSARTAIAEDTAAATD